MPSDIKPRRYKIGKALRLPRIGCIAGRFAVISGGFDGKACAKEVYLLDTASPPAAGTSLPVLATLNSTGAVAVATTLNDKSVGFFDGEVLDIFTVA